MAINVNAAGNVSPSVMEGGTAGDNKATNISFVLDQSLVSGEKFYQIQALTAQGVFDVTEYLTPEENTLSYDIPFGWSVGGGVSAIRILITTPNGDNPTLWYSDPVSVTFKPNPQGKFCLQNPFALLKLESQTKEFSEQAQQSANLAEEMVYSASQYEENAKQHALQAEQAANDAVNKAFPLVSNALKRIVSGEIIKITDASPLPHLATVTVNGADQAYVAGKNLCDGVLSFGIVGGAESKDLARKNLDFLPAGRYTFSFSPSIYWQSPRGEAYGITTDPSTIKLADDGGILSVVVDITDPSIALIQFRCQDYATYPVPKDVVRMQIEFGETLTEYTPYVEPIVVPSGGSVQLPQGVATIYAKDAVVTCEYNRDINKAFEELRQAIINLGGNV